MTGCAFIKEKYSFFFKFYYGFTVVFGPIWAILITLIKSNYVKKQKIFFIVWILLYLYQFNHYAIFIFLNNQTQEV